MKDKIPISPRKTMKNPPEKIQQLLIFAFNSAFNKAFQTFKIVSVYQFFFFTVAAEHEIFRLVDFLYSIQQHKRDEVNWRKNPSTTF